MKIVVASGYFDPLHIGHVRYLEAARALGDRLIVIVNADKQARIKKGQAFMLENERREIVAALRCVDEAVISIDTDRTVLETLKTLQFDVFAKGGDSTLENTPEFSYLVHSGKEIHFDAGGGKIQSSSWLIHGKS